MNLLEATIALEAFGKQKYGIDVTIGDTVLKAPKSANSFEPTDGKEYDNRRGDRCICSEGRRQDGSKVWLELNLDTTVMTFGSRTYE